MQRLLILAVALIVTAVLATDAEAQLFRRRGCDTGCGTSSGCNVGSGGCNVGSSQGCNISSQINPARASDLIQQPALPPAANAQSASRKLPSPFAVDAKPQFVVKPVRSGYSEASVLAFAAPVKESPTKPERYMASRPEASKLASR